jgi:peptide deformylase
LAILRVAQMGHPVLRLVSEPVDPADIPTEDFQRFCDDLLETMDEYDGAGLAAPQVYTSLRVVVLTLDADKGPEFLINPEIEVLSELSASTVEGCLSVSKLRGVVERPAHIRVRAYGRDGQPKAYELKGFPAVVTQHECDHLDGVLYIDRVDPLTLAFLDEYQRFGRLDQYVEGYEPDEDIEDLIVELDVDDAEAAPAADEEE